MDLPLHTGIMNVMLQHHGTKRIYPVPEGLRELCTDISREILRVQPANIYGFIAEYVEALLISRDHARVATRILGEIMDESVSYEAAWKRRDISEDDTLHAAIIIQSAYRGYHTRKTYKKQRVTCKLLVSLGLDSANASKACIIIQNAYRGHLARKHVKTHTVPEDVDMSPEDKETFNRFMISMNLSWTQANAAATRIQTAFRKMISKSKEQLKVKEIDPFSLTHAEITGLAQEMVSTLITRATEPEESKEVVDSIISYLVSEVEEIIKVFPLPERTSKIKAISAVQSILNSLIMRTMEEAKAPKLEQAEEAVEVQESISGGDIPDDEDMSSVVAEIDKFYPSTEEIRHLTTSEESKSEHVHY